MGGDELWAGCLGNRIFLPEAHDVVEDTDATIADIRKEYGNQIAQIVDTLKRRKGETYTKYIERIAQDKEAIKVKLADLADNTDQEHSDSLSKSLRKRYADAL